MPGPCSPLAQLLSQVWLAISDTAPGCTAVPGLCGSVSRLPWLGVPCTLGAPVSPPQRAASAVPGCRRGSPPSCPGLPTTRFCLPHGFESSPSRYQASPICMGQGRVPGLGHCSADAVLCPPGLALSSVPGPLPALSPGFLSHCACLSSHAGGLLLILYHLAGAQRPQAGPVRVESGAELEERCCPAPSPPRLSELGETPDLALKGVVDSCCGSFQGGLLWSLQRPQASARWAGHCLVHRKAPGPWQNSLSLHPRCRHPLLAASREKFPKIRRPEREPAGCPVSSV